MASWQTSIIGIVLILIGGVGIKWGSIDPLIGGAIITAGLGFLRAKDSNVTGGSVPQASPPGVALKSDALGVNAIEKQEGVTTRSERAVKAEAQAVVDTPPSLAIVDVLKKEGDCK